MVLPRRLWDSNIVTGYLSGQQSIKTDCELIIQQADRGEIEIVVSTLAQAEVAYLQGVSSADSEDKIQEFFSRSYIITAAFDISITKEVRRLIRTYQGRLKPPDAVHVATAVQWHIPILETTDSDLLKLDKREGNPPLIIRKPTYEGPMPFQVL